MKLDPASRRNHCEGTRTKGGEATCWRKTCIIQRWCRGCAPIPHRVESFPRYRCLLDSRDAPNFVATFLLFIWEQFTRAIQITDSIEPGNVFAVAFDDAWQEEEKPRGKSDGNVTSWKLVLILEKIPSSMYIVILFFIFTQFVQHGREIKIFQLNVKYHGWKYSLESLDIPLTGAETI